jgi:hypothetical protein
MLYRYTIALVGKRLISAVTILFLAIQSQGQQSIEIIQGQRTAITIPIKSWKADSADPVLKIKTRDEKGLIHAQDLEPLLFTQYGSKTREEDMLWQKDTRGFQKPHPSNLRNAPMNLIPLERNGGYVDKALDGQGFSNINPADPSIAVGPNHIIQMINGNNGSALFSIYDKSGNTVFPQTYMDQLPGSSYNGGGDCIAWYDQLSDRFVMSEFGDSSKTGIKINSLIMAVSASNDPTGAWFIYEFYCDPFFPDYPKYGNWHDAWYGVTRDFSDQYLGNSIWAFDKNKMISGAANPTVQRLRLTDPDNKFNALVPVTLTGNNPPLLGTPGLFLYYNDDVLTASPSDADSIGLISFKVDFTDPSKSLIKTEKNFAVAAFNSIVCNSRNCATSPGPQGYDVVSNRIMHKPGFRNFGTHQSIVANHTVDVNGNGLSGIRWYELRNTTGWTLYQQGSYAPQAQSNCNSNNLRHRFMGSIVQNGKGQIALAYNFSSKNDFASIAFTGRNQNDPLNQMAFEETNIKKGTGYGTSANRWGDYNDMVPDPSNDSVFWFTGMIGNTANTWSTSLSSFYLRNNPQTDAKLSGIVYPNACEPICASSFQPKITIRNSGTEVLQSVRITVLLNDNKINEELWTGNLAYTEEILFTLKTLTIPQGKTALKIMLDRPNAKADQMPGNDSASIAVELQSIQTMPIVETAESGSMPPVGWSFQTNGSSTLGWKNTNKASYEGSRSLVFDNFNNDEKGKTADLLGQRINASNYDSLSMEFMLAAALYDAINLDTLEIMVSADCGKSFNSVYKKWGTTLSTKAGFTSTEFIPVKSDWRKETIDLSRFKGNDIQIRILGTNQYGNNIYLDNINIAGFFFPAADVKTDSIDTPTLVGCEPLIAPIGRFTSLGKDTLKSLDLQLWVNGLMRESKKWNGILLRNKAASVSFSSLAIPEGIHNINIVAANPNGQVDQNKMNDTAHSVHHYLKPIDMPFKESFNGLNQWPIYPIHGNDKWQKGLSSSAMVARNFQRPSFVSGMISPLVIRGNPDSVFLDFDLAANTSIVSKPDTLEIAISWDCGKNWQSVYKKWGSTLSTADRNTSTSFEPLNATEWRKERIDLTSMVNGKNTFMTRFVNIGNGNNNVYIDNVNITSITLPQRLKDQGHLLYPNPASTNTAIQFFPAISNLKSIQLSDAKGGIVLSYQYKTGQSLNFQQINLAGLPAGVYFLNIQFTDKSITEKLIKMPQ